MILERFQADICGIQIVRNFLNVITADILCIHEEIDNEVIMTYYEIMN